MKNRLEEIRKDRGIRQEDLDAALEVSSDRWRMAVTIPRSCWRLR